MNKIPIKQTFFDMHDIGDMLVQAQLADPVMDMEYLTLTYAHPRQLFAELKANGASNASMQQCATLMGKQKLARCISNYEAFKNKEGVYPATFEIIYGHAWQPATINYINTLNEVSVPLKQIKRSSEG